jgi:glyoxylase-like metal-dependent hydrolase (beta-lactamase superfamily II)
MNILVDAGMGDKMPEELDIYGVDRQFHLDHSLAASGLSARDIDIVIASHLHFDPPAVQHIAMGQRCPPRPATVRRGEWEDATHPHERNRASYLGENFLPLQEAGVWFIEADGDVLPGTACGAPGAHEHHQLIRIESAADGSVSADAPDDRASGRGLDHGLRPVPHGHVRLQEGIHA